MNQKAMPAGRQGFSIVLVIILISLVAGAGFLFLKQSPQSQNLQTAFNNPESPPNPDEPPLKLKSIGVNLDYYDPTTNKAGDFIFTKQKLEFNRLFMGFGFVIPANVSSNNQAKSTPQPTFIVPLGTPVRSLVDGVVAAIPTLWSGDVSIQVTTDGKLQKWVYETEHVRNPKVKVGDQVTAGQVIAEVGNFGNNAPPGFGVVEIGILKGGQQPQHVCPFAYLDESIKTDTLGKIGSLFKSWEDYTGDQSLYDETSISGCLTLDPIKG